ncbi:DUF2142 domain-containing protein, partial [Candidatus Dojkabacteria bacterium]|nr:DUF2142 domain-containing protein [Candidatus Dojkabacteria bacterium]
MTIYVVVIVTVLFIIYSAIVPVLQNPDESPHIRYIEFILQNHRLPGKEEYSDGRVLNQSSFLIQLNQLQQSLKIARNPNFHFPFDSIMTPPTQDIHLSYIFNHPPAYYLYAMLFFGFGWLISNGFALIGIKLANYFLLLVSLYYSYQVGKLFSDKKDTLFPYVLGLLVTSWPMYLFLSTGANNDLLVVSASCGLSFYLIRAEKRASIKVKDFLMICIFLSIGILTKAQFFVFVPVVFWVILKYFKTLEVGKNYKKLILSCVPLFFPLYFYINQIILYGQILPTPRDISYDNAQAVVSCHGYSLFHYVKVWFFPRIPMIAQSFIGNFGWLDTKASKETILIVSIVVLLGLGGFLIGFLTKKKFRSEFKPFVRVVVPIALLLESFYSFLFFREYLQRCYVFFPTQGGYYFLLLLPLSFAVLVGLRKLLTPLGEKYAYIII